MNGHHPEGRPAAASYTGFAERNLPRLSPRGARMRGAHLSRDFHGLVANSLFMPVAPEHFFASGGCSLLLGASGDRVQEESAGMPSDGADLPDRHCRCLDIKTVTWILSAGRSGAVTGITDGLINTPGGDSVAGLC